MSVIKTSTPTKDGRQWQFRISYKDATGKRHTHASKLYKTKTEAKAEEARYRAEAFEVAPASATFDDLWEGWKIVHDAEVKPQTATRVHTMYTSHIQPVLGQIIAAKLTVAQYERFKQSLKDKGLSTHYCNKIHGVVLNLLRYGKRYYGIHNDAPELAGRFKEPQQIKEEMKFYTIEEYQKYRRQLEPPVWLGFFDTLYFLGLRKGEAMALTWHDVDLNNKIARIYKTAVTKIKGERCVINSPKTRSSNRDLPLPDILVSDLKAIHTYYESFAGFSEDWYIFGGLFPVSETSIDVHNRAAASAAGLDRIRIHDFRHSCASLLINNGANITVVAKYLGHSNIEMTLNTYSHFYKSKLEEVTDLINKIK